MKRNLQDIDKLFADVLKDHREDPPQDTWQQIENDLNRRDAEKYKAKYYSLRRTVVAAALICACLLLNDVLQSVMTTSQKVEWSMDYFAHKKLNIDNNEVISAINRMKENNSNKNLLSVDFDEISENYANNSPAETIESSERKGNLISASQFITGSLVNNPSLLIASKTLNSSRPTLQAQYQSLNSKEGQLKQKHDFYIIPYFSFDQIEGRLEQEYEYGDEDVSAYAKRERPDKSYTAGLMFEYGVSKKFSLQSGLTLSNAFTSVSPTVVKAMPDNSGLYKFKLATTYGLAEIKKTGISSPQTGDSILVTDAMIHLIYYTVPVLAKVKLKQGKLNVSVSAGAAFNVITGDKAEVSYVTPTSAEVETVQKIEGVKNSFLSVIGGAEVAYSINRNISAGINPVVRYSVTPVNKGTPIKTYPISFGIGATVQIKL